jgi:nitrogenase molybdenum-iron protein NifN
MTGTKLQTAQYSATKNSCKLCAPLGASLVFKGIENAVPLIHGSQGCSTYIRRYLISHFKEPIDIASSNFSEETAIFGGKANLETAILNITKQYNPDLIGICSTCLSETIGEDIALILKEILKSPLGADLPQIIYVSTPSYKGYHADGFNDTVKTIIEQITESSVQNKKLVNILPSMISPEDIRTIKEMVSDFGLEYIILPDYSETLDGPLWDEYNKIPQGGTKLKDIKKMASAAATIQFGSILASMDNGAKILQARHGVKNLSMDVPMGVAQTDKFLSFLAEIANKDVPEKYIKQRGRLLDAYADGHKYVFNARAIVYGEEDFVVAMAGFLAEIGIIPVLCASGGKSGLMTEKIIAVTTDIDQSEISVCEGMDFVGIEEKATVAQADFVIGNSKGFKLSENLNIPIIRTGFPIHDRFGGARIRHIGYEGAMSLFDKIVNTILEKQQKINGWGYTYL